MFLHCITCSGLNTQDSGVCLREFHPLMGIFKVLTSVLNRIIIIQCIEHTYSRSPESTETQIACFLVHVWNLLFVMKEGHLQFQPINTDGEAAT